MMNVALLVLMAILCGCSVITTEKNPDREKEESIIIYHTPQVVHKEKPISTNMHWRDKVKKSPVTQMATDKNPEIVPVIEDVHKPWVFFWVTVVVLIAVVYLMFFRPKKGQ
jgi:hypothetical protein